MTCKDCAWFDVCYKVEHYGRDTETICQSFKNKADYVEVVRCKDCTFRQPIDEGRYTFKGKPAMVCILHSKAVAEDGYCSYGEKRQKNDFKE